MRPLAEAPELVALIADRIAGWNDRAPDPDQPLLVESPQDRKRRGKTGEDVEEPTKWWVYATIGGALLTGALIIYGNTAADNTQRVELHYP